MGNKKYSTEEERKEARRIYQKEYSKNIENLIQIKQINVLVIGKKLTQKKQKNQVKKNIIKIKRMVHRENIVKQYHTYKLGVTF